MDTGDRRDERPRDAAERDEVDALFEGAHPDPEFDAIGHPPDSKLVEIAEGRVDQDDPVFAHIERCSQCYRRMRELREAAASRRPSRKGGARWWIAAVAAAGVVLALLAIGARWWPDGRSVVPGGTSARLVAELDLRPYGASRGDGGNEVQPLVLRRGVVDLMMILPTGAEPGRYDIQLLDDGAGDLKSRKSTTAEGTLRKHGTEVRTELRTVLDIGDVPPGRYQLALRYAAERWRLFPVEVVR